MISTRFFLAAALTALSLSSVPATAQNTSQDTGQNTGPEAPIIPGQSDPAFAAAVTDWLSGTDDLAALGALSTLANEGNAAAQILLARIAAAPHLHAHVTDALPRADRIALLRQPGGLSGRSWLEAAAETSPLAQAFIDIARPDTREDAIVPLLDAGEAVTVTRSLSGLMAYGRDAWFGILDVFDQMPDEARILISAQVGRELFWESNGAVVLPNALSERRSPELALIWNPFHPTEWGTLPAGNAAWQMALDASPRIESLAPLHATCAQICPGDVAACTAVGASLGAMGGHPFPFASPTDALLPTQTYAASARFADDVLRRLRVDASAVDQDSHRAASACYVDRIALGAETE